MTQHSNSFTTSIGHIMSGADWLDVHFEAARHEYEAQLRAVGIQPGWHMLDAASGSGSYLPWMAELVGSRGQLSALDLAPDNVARIERRLPGWQLKCPVEARVGSVVDLPYPANTFDAVWFANTSQFLTDDELRTTLSEFRRVVRPGGLVALKESDTTMYRVYPGPPGVIYRWFQAAADAGIGQWVTGPRVPELPSWLRRSGIQHVWQRTTLIERSAPFDLAMRETFRGLFTLLAGSAAELDLPSADQTFWTQFSDPLAFDRFVDNPDCWLIEANILAVGTMPIT